MDIVKRLRELDEKGYQPHTGAIGNEAADEVERLGDIVQKQGVLILMQEEELLDIRGPLFPPAKVECPSDVFENAIRAFGVVAACEWFGYASDSEFTAETVRVLKERSNNK